jgi:hypothetical protein
MMSCLLSCLCVYDCCARKERDSCAPYDTNKKKENRMSPCILPTDKKGNKRGGTINLLRVGSRNRLVHSHGMHSLL